VPAVQLALKQVQIFFSLLNCRLGFLSSCLPAGDLSEAGKWAECPAVPIHLYAQVAGYFQDAQPGFEFRDLHEKYFVFYYNNSKL